MSSTRPKIYQVNPSGPESAAVESAARVVLAGGLVAFPTETVYGLGANGLDPAAVAGIFEAKRRPKWNPVILHVNGIEDVVDLVADALTEIERRLLDRYWPGPLTIVVERSARVPDIVTGGGSTVGLRAPAHPVAQAFIRAAGVPIAAPSANVFMGVSPTSAMHVERSLGDRVDVILDGGDSAVGIESTVCRVVGANVMILREGGITREMMEQDGFAVVGSSAETVFESSSGHVPSGDIEAATVAAASPGQHVRHYAPSAKLTVLEGDADFVSAELMQQLDDVGVGFVAWKDTCTWLREAQIAESRIIEQTSGQANEAYARELYRSLHEVDVRGFRETFLVAPQSGPLDTAIHDRLRRASDAWIQQRRSRDNLGT